MLKKLIIGLIHWYQKIPGNIHSSCRFTPTCSNYMIEAIELHGLCYGMYLGIRRILRCHPFGKFGYDPVPKVRRKRMKRKKLLLLFLLFIAAIFTTTGCKQDDMDDIRILVTNYPNEYITEALYGDHSSITAVYPDGVDTDKYKISSKQKKDFSQYDLFIYNGLIKKESDLAFDLLDLIKKDIDEAYENLKVTLSELDADYRLAVENTDEKTLVVANSTLKYLEKFGLTILCVDDDASAKTIDEVKDLIDSGQISYIYTFTDDKVNDKAQELLDEYPDLKKEELHKLNNLSDSDRANKLTYINIMNNNLDWIRQELYQ